MSKQQSRTSGIPLSTGLALAALLIGGAGIVPTIDGQTGLPIGEWREYTGDSYGTKYSPLDQITAGNVQDLRVVWRWRSPDAEVQRANPTMVALRTSRNEDTPLLVRGVMYHVTGLGQVAAIDPGTGQTRWIYDPQSWKLGRPNNGGFLERGMGYWTDGKSERLLVGTHDGYLLSIDAATGKPDPAFGEGGKADLMVEIRDAVRSTVISARRPLVAGNVVVVGSSISDAGSGRNSPPGYVHAFDVRSGKRLWTFHTVPRPGEFGYDTWLKGSAEFNGNTNVWGGMSYDRDLDYIYLPTSTPSSDYYGTDRPGNNLFAESLVCVEAKTGKRVWHFQAVHHGLWDYDFPTIPILGEITANGRRIKAVIQVSKQGFTYAFDRKTGQPIWPIEERPVPQTKVPGEWTSPTQPFPTKPPAFELQGTTEENLIDFTPELRQRAREVLRAFDHGPLFTPPTEKGLLALPGNLGGANWGGAAFDPETGMLYVPSRTTPTLMRARPLTAGAPDPERGGGVPRASGGGPPNAGQSAPSGPRPSAGGPPQAPDIDGLSIFKPPYARVTAIDMNKGTHVWMSPLGNGPRNHPLLRGLDVPPLGDFVDGESVLATKSLLFVTVWRRQRGNGFPLVTPWKPEYGDPDAARKLLYVFHKQTGKLLREIQLDGHSAAAPMTYTHGGKQYLAIAVGANAEAEIVSLGLPPPSRGN
jgi:quinoprotein glucose dehydrogenase